MAKEHWSLCYRRIFLSIIMIILNLCALFPETKHIKIGVYDNSPKIFRSESGKAEGIFIDIIEDIAKKEAWTMEYVYGTWEEG